MTEAPVQTTVAALGARQFARALKTGIGIQLGPFSAMISVRAGELIDPLFELYRDYKVIERDEVYSFHVKLEEKRSFPRLYRRLVRFSVDGQVPHEDANAEQALAVLEWGINLVIALRSHSFLMLHSAVVEKDGNAVVLPAAPGFGKTTLCAALCHSGWRLLSDEFGLLRPGTTEFIPVPRPMALKNESIDVIREFAPGAIIGPEIPNTRKGRVAHVKPPTASVERSRELAPLSHIVFPRWQYGSSTTFSKIPKAEAFMLLATNAFNYEVLGESGFLSVARLIEQAPCYQLEYSDLMNAVPALSDFIRRHDP
jgi:HprK-related kinase A